MRVNGVPVIGVVGWKNSGKTTLAEALVRAFTELGLRVAVLKHDVHGFDMDREGTDSWRIGRAGAAVVAVSGPGQTAIRFRHDQPLGFAPAVGATLAAVAAAIGAPTAPEGTVPSVLPSANPWPAGLAAPDLMLVEGYKAGPAPKVEVIGPGALAEGGPGLATPRPEELLAVVSRTPLTDAERSRLPEGTALFLAGEAEELARFLLQREGIRPLRSETPRGAAVVPVPGAAAARSEHPSMVRPDEARRLVRESVPVLPPERVGLDEVAGRVLAEDVVAQGLLPPFDRSAMDGFAVRSVDTRGASREAPARLRVVGALYAGERPPEGPGAPLTPLAPGTALRVATGAPVPEGADAVVPIEAVEEISALAPGQPAETLIVLSSPVNPGANVFPAGEDARPGDRLLGAGTVIAPAAAALLAYCGVDPVLVGRRPVVAILATGDELVPPEATPGYGQVRNSNAVGLAALVRAWGGVPRLLGIARDDEADLRAHLALARGADALVVIGGMSKGDRDLPARVLEADGVRWAFRGVRMKPGKPASFGLWPQEGSAAKGPGLDGSSPEGLGSQRSAREGSTEALPLPVFGLPGNPSAALVAARLLLRPALLRMQGAAAEVVEDRPLEAELGAPLEGRAGRRRYVWATLRLEGGRLLALPEEEQGVTVVRSSALADGLVVVEEGTGTLGRGERVAVHLMTGLTGLG